MKKKIRDKVVYEENPWGDDEPVLGKRVRNLFPANADFKHAKINVTRSGKKISLELKDDQKLKKKAKQVGISANALISAIISDFLRGRLVYADKYRG